MLPSGYYLRCIECGRMFAEDCVRQIAVIAKCGRCRDKSVYIDRLKRINEKKIKEDGIRCLATESPESS
jgi:hypothetical protein